MAGRTELRAEGSRLELTLHRQGDELGLIPYTMAGYPDRSRSIEHGRAYARAGAAAVEVGVPYSDPLADGPVVQRAGQAALDQGTTLADSIRVAAAIAEEGAPVVLMTYVNPILSHGAKRFAADCAGAGIAGVIVPDVPAEESEPLTDPLRAAGLDTIFLVAPTSPDARIRQIVQQSSGFVYCVTLAGVTGPRAELDPGLEALLLRLRAATTLPVAAGFGISTPVHLRRLRGKADAAVVASALLARIHAGEEPLTLAGELLQACR
ncbi:MAG: tryptophan synthase subunit alpha [Candidatus Dormibacteraeota bacterium]|uniref:Tryptophan synthase alpha chain n=1 Tax=Candidatus Dormiibacter inghamiae TaxID=3127013 RepID=A0A934KDC6_9BACT|nr:tryptophan synthase subunit alpha [Candidatus Dormibacteraeota bacterium]MBJ7604831.1 tryptophan synthase subunit alpha [Candidatus Dormibacteraeota bacterium]